jgi:hypothetical protein
MLPLHAGENPAEQDVRAMMDHDMGPGIIIPVLLLAVAVPVVFVWARRRFKQPAVLAGELPSAPAARLTSNALRALGSPPWRVVYEIAEERMDGVEHVLIGPAGIFALVTSMDPLPSPVIDPDPHAVAAAAIMRGGLDDALRRCAMTSDRLLTIHWGANDAAAPTSIESLPGATAVDGRHVDEWAATAATGRDGPPLTQAQIDLAWQTVVTAIGRPDPLG